MDAAIGKVRLKEVLSCLDLFFLVCNLWSWISHERAVENLHVGHSYNPPPYISPQHLLFTDIEPLVMEFLVECYEQFCLFFTNVINRCILFFCLAAQPSRFLASQVGSPPPLAFAVS